MQRLNSAESNGVLAKVYSDPFGKLSIIECCVLVLISPPHINGNALQGFTSSVMFVSTKNFLSGGFQMKIVTALALGTSILIFNTTPTLAASWGSPDWHIEKYNERHAVKIYKGGTKKAHRVVKRLKLKIEKGHPQYAYRGIGDVLRAMNRQAKAAGANAIIHFKFSEDRLQLFSWGAVHGSGVAIKYK